MRIISETNVNGELEDIYAELDPVSESGTYHVPLAKALVDSSFNELSGIKVKTGNIIVATCPSHIPVKDFPAYATEKQEALASMMSNYFRLKKLMAIAKELDKP